MKYRPDIDGLRALAVLAVVLFHAGWPVPGGFVGVDVFFVISGFLITTQLVGDLEADRCSLMRFWERRIRRIWPASLLMTASVLVVGGILMLPADYATLAVDAASATGMLANVRFWLRGTDHYFEAAADVRPMLHMWSLAVEEQFYMVWPLLLAAVWRHGRRVAMTVIAGIASASFIASQSMIAGHPDATFYLLPSRAWELLIGALIAVCPMILPRHPVLRAAVAPAGLMMILAPCAWYGRTTPFPAAAALPPCVGTALLITAGANAGVAASPVTRWLAAPPLVAIGRISYSLYLWHWPVFAFLRYVFDRDLPPQLNVAALSLSVVLAAISWRWVELPFRQPGAATHSPPRTSSLRVAAAATAACTIVLGAAAAIRLSAGMPARLSPGLVAFANTATWNAKFRLPNRTAADGSWRFPVLGMTEHSATPCFFLWGDSHGVAISEAVDVTARQLGIAGVAALRPATLPLPGAWNPRSRSPDGARGPQATEAWCQGGLDWIRDHRPRHVILCGRWHKPANPLAPIAPEADADSSYTALLRGGLERIRLQCERVGATLWLLRQVPTQPLWRRRVIESHLLGRPLDLRGIDRATHDGDLAAVDDVFKALADEHVRLIDLAEPFFGDDGISRVGLEDESWYYDRSHVSPAGARRVLGGIIRDMLEEVRRDCGAPDP